VGLLMQRFPAEGVFDRRPEAHLTVQRIYIGCYIIVAFSPQEESILWLSDALDQPYILVKTGMGVCGGEKEVF
jgi:hypothetical protein